MTNMVKQSTQYKGSFKTVQTILTGSCETLARHLIHISELSTFGNDLRCEFKFADDLNGYAVAALFEFCSGDEHVINISYGHAEVNQTFRLKQVTVENMIFDSRAHQQLSDREPCAITLVVKYNGLEPLKD